MQYGFNRDFSWIWDITWWFIPGIVSGLVHPNYKWIKPTEIPCQSLGLYPTYDSWDEPPSMELHGTSAAQFRGKMFFPNGSVTGKLANEEDMENQHIKFIAVL